MCVCVQEELTPHGPDSCPCVWALQSSPLVPVGFDTELSLQGKNLDIFEVIIMCGLTLRPSYCTSVNTLALVVSCLCI